MRTLIAVAAAGLLAGCGGSPGPWLDYSIDESLAAEKLPTEAARPEFDPAMYENVKTFTLGTELRPAAKTIDWASGGISEGTTFMNGAVVVDSITRQDADDFYNIRVRLRNRTDRPAPVEWMAAFFDGSGKRLIGLNDYRGYEPVYRPVMLDAFGTTTIANASRLKGAVSFALYVRLAGTKGSGNPDSGGTAPPAAAASADDDLLESLGK